MPAEAGILRGCHRKADSLPLINGASNLKVYETTSLFLTHFEQFAGNGSCQ